MPKNRTYKNFAHSTYHALKGEFNIRTLHDVSNTTLTIIDFERGSLFNKKVYELMWKINLMKSQPEIVDKALLYNSFSLESHTRTQGFWLEGKGNFGHINIGHSIPDLPSFDTSKPIIFGVRTTKIEFNPYQTQHTNNLYFYSGDDT
jgi:hypothetical protein